MKKILSATLALAMTLSLLPAAFAAGGTAYASTQTVEVDGKKVEFQMYALKDDAGNPTNYVKLRDVAHVLNGTKAQFSVGYDGSISVTTGQPYADAGGEMTTPYSGDRAYRDGSGSVKVNGQSASLESIILTDDAGGGYTYFKLRDLGTALGFQVDWSADRGVFLNTGGSSQPTEKTPLEQIQGIWYGKNEEVQGEAIEQEYKIEGDRLFQISYIDMYYYMEGTIVGIELEDGLYAIKLKDCKGINVSTSDTTIYDRGSWEEDTIYLDLQSNMLTDVTLDIVLSPASALQLYPRFQAALEAAQNKPNSYTMTTAEAYNKLRSLYNKELDATETIVYSVGSVSYIAIANQYVGGADSKLAIELMKLRNHVLTARSYLEEESVGMLAICDQAPGFEKVKPILLNIKERLDNIQAVTESSGKVNPNEFLAQSEAIIGYWRGVP